MKTIPLTRSVFFLLLLLFCIPLNAQNFQWANQADVTANTVSEVSRLRHDAGNNYFICGTFRDSIKFDSLLLEATNAPVQYDKGFVVKYNTNGHVVYAKKINGRQVVPYDIAVSSSGIVYVTGTFQDSLRLDNVFLQTDSANAIEGFILKLDYSGNGVWGMRASSYDQVMHLEGIALDQDENIFVTGFYLDSVTLGTQSAGSLHSNGYEILLAKLDSSGNTLWLKSAGGSHTDQGRQVSTDLNGNAFMTGSFIDSAHFDGFTVTNRASSIFVAKYDGAGNVNWAKGYGGKNSTSGQETGVDITTDRNGNVCFTGLVTDTALFGSDTIISPPPGIRLLYRRIHCKA